MAATSFHVVPDSLFRASTRFLDLQVASGRILGVLGHGLASTGGMSGSDDAGRAFASRYQPAAQSASNGLARSNKQLGDIADGLLAMAFNYLQAELGSNFLVPKAMQDGPTRSCRADEQAVAIPSALGRGQESSIPLIGQFWPQGDPVRLRTAAGAWRQVAALAEELSRRGSIIVADVAATNSGRAVDSFAQSWTPMTTVLAEIAALSRKLATAADTYAQHIDDQRRTIEEIAATIAVATTAGIVLTVFTLGASDVVAEGSDAVLIATAADAAVTYSTEVAAAGEVAALAAADEAVAGVVVTLPLIAPVAAGAELVGVSADFAAVVVPPGVVLFLNGVQDVAAADNPPYSTITSGYANPYLNGALPPEPGSPFPPLSPQSQLEALAWVRGLRSIPTPTGSPWGQYQVRVAGPQQYVMPTGDGRMVAADGFRPLDGAIVDAKYTDDPTCSPYNLDNRGDAKAVFQPMYENVLADGNDEFNRYAAVITDPANHAKFLEVVVSNPKEVPYFQFLMAQQHVTGLIRVVP